MRLRQAADELPHSLQVSFHHMLDEIVRLSESLDNMDRHLIAWLAFEPDGPRLERISGVGVVTATTRPLSHSPTKWRASSGRYGHNRKTSTAMTRCASTPE